MYNSKDKFVVYSTVCTMSIFIALYPHPSANLRLVYLQRILRKFENEKHYVVSTERIMDVRGNLLLWGHCSDSPELKGQGHDFRIG
jgi:hypothetical protein